MRIAACLEYNGSAFRGWQYQTHAPCVQIPVEKALSTVADEAIKVVCAGRTDAGVHALHQVIHFDTQAKRLPKQWKNGANKYLPNTIVVHWATEVSEGFHARFSARSRLYTYIVLNSGSHSALFHNFVGWNPHDLDADAMNDAAQALVGEHDFSSFRAAGCKSRTAIRRISTIEVRRRAELIYIHVQANAFLQHMVRNIVGTLIEVGKKERAVSEMALLLKQRDRSKSGMTASPYGLYLNGITYPENFQLQSSRTARWPFLHDVAGQA